jgi:hypothetical protein
MSQIVGVRAIAPVPGNGRVVHPPRNSAGETVAPAPSNVETLMNSRLFTGSYSP